MRRTNALNEASSAETPYGRYITSEGWFVLNLADALALRNDEKGGAAYPIESREHPCRDVGVNVKVLWPGEPNALYHSEDVQEGAGEGPCAILMIGARPVVGLRYPASEVAAKHGASVAKETIDPDEAYADWPADWEPVRLPWPPDS